MKINFHKAEGGQLIPASDLDQESMTKFKTGEIYEVEIKRYRNPKFHGKVFAFFNHCFQFWKSDKEFMDEAGQFDVFRKNMTVLAGYYNEYYNLKGEVRIKAKSLSYGQMTPEQFEQVYNSLVQVAMKKIFNGLSDDEVYQKLQGFL